MTPEFADFLLATLSLAVFTVAAFAWFLAGGR